SLAVFRDFKPEADNEPKVDPCQERYRPIILYFPGDPVSLWYCRASLMAASVTSEPPHWNFTVDKSPGAKSARRLASCTATGFVPCITGEKAKVSSWR